MASLTGCDIAPAPFLMSLIVIDLDKGLPMDGGLFRKWRGE